ncbi:histidine kinase [Streptomyces sp. RY43-2]|uniref:Histidine kinase n=1 Tax=Streptomyces macrolidinus TaxID=2952607 RepID=A0ABT0ZFQ7_9ACTN|nr:histidine kinase [Streptomyces macrolidinus]MCN9242416.1 histidine kinase [Streptomyces macrolidinus]
MTDRQDRFGSADESRGEREAAVPPGDSGVLPAPRSAYALIVAVLLGYALLASVDILSTDVSLTARVTGVLVLLLILGLQLLHSAVGGSRAPLGRKCLTLAAQALLTYLPLLLFRTYWGTMTGYLAGSLLLLLPPLVAWPLYGTVGLSMLVLAVLDGRPVIDGIHLAQTSLLAGLVLYGLTRLTELITQLHAGRGELARQAVAGERLRFARDLHDLLGYSLSAITLKSELIHRLIPTHPAHALKEVDEVLAIAGQSLADVRKVASGFRDLSLRQEIGTTRSMLSAAGIDVRAEVDLGVLSPHVDTALATTLREAVTNLLRHSNASRCGIRAVQQGGSVRLVVENDGVDPACHDPSPHGGNGLGNLHARITAVGGRLESHLGTDGVFRLQAEVPARKPPETNAEVREVVFPPKGSAA